MKEPETGPIRFGEEPTGAYIRGEDAHVFALAIGSVLAGRRTQLDAAALERLGDVLAASLVKKPEGRANLREFRECSLGHEGMHYLIISKLINEAVGCCYNLEDAAMRRENPGADFQLVTGKCPACKKEFQ